MRYPLAWYHRLGREIACTVLTHRWKSSWHKRADYDWAAENYKELPYGRRNSGNGLYEYSETWSYKCRRCRKSLRVERPQELRLQLYWGFRSAIRMFSIMFRMYPVPKSLLLAPVALLSDFFIHQEWMWPTIRLAPANLLYWLYDKIE